jgi:hypothetical protein
VPEVRADRLAERKITTADTTEDVVRRGEDGVGAYI